MTAPCVLGMSEADQRKQRQRAASHGRHIAISFGISQRQVFVEAQFRSLPNLAPA